MIRIIITLVVLINISVAKAQCVNTPMPTCEVYETCFAKLCNCDGSPYEYFKSYGKKYCEVFLDLPNLSPKGKAWRNSTLKCLQESIVPKLPADNKYSVCDCKSMQLAAFDSHVACYTQPSNSICSLDSSDWFYIMKAVDPVKSLIDQKSRKQMLDVANICLPIAVEGAKAPIRLLINKLK